MKYPLAYAVGIMVSLRANPREFSYSKDGTVKMNEKQKEGPKGQIFGLPQIVEDVLVDKGNMFFTNFGIGL